MNIDILPVGEELIEDYLYFFENVAHEDNKEWDRCYCVNYCSDDNWKIAGELDDPDVRRDYAIKYIKEGILKGYLAYVDGQVAGWCNANERKDCLKCFGNYFIYGDKAPAEDPHKVKSIFCFTVAPAMRGKHIASMLLERVIEDARKDGYEYLEAYPEKGEVNMYNNYCGPKKLYEKYGFVDCGETDKRLVVRKELL